MNRRALQALFRHLVLAALPLGGCSEHALPQDSGDMSCAPALGTCSPGDMACTPIAPFDMVQSHPDFEYYTLVDGAYPAGSDQDGHTCNAVCRGLPWGCRRVATQCGQTVFDCYGTGIGRLPAGLQASPSTSGLASDASALTSDRSPHDPSGAVGSYWAGAARLEAASVFAFRTLERELRAHGAPQDLVARAARAARDEVRHARITAALARRAGASVAPVVVTATPSRGLAEIAEENAVEGCVRETWGAVVAQYQAQAAQDPVARRALGRIAVDEARHAELAWAVADWAEPRLSDLERTRTRAARRAAFGSLLSAVTSAAPPDLLRDTVGLPPTRAAQKLAAGLVAALAA